MSASHQDNANDVVVTSVPPTARIETLAYWLSTRTPHFFDPPKEKDKRRFIDLDDKAKRGYCVTLNWSYVLTPAGLAWRWFPGLTPRVMTRGRVQSLDNNKLAGALEDHYAEHRKMFPEQQV